MRTAPAPPVRRAVVVVLIGWLLALAVLRCEFWSDAVAHEHAEPAAMVDIAHSHVEPTPHAPHDLAQPAVLPRDLSALLILAFGVTGALALVVVAVHRLAGVTPRGPPARPVTGRMLLTRLCIDRN